jgi:hypothetical protein
MSVESAEMETTTYSHSEKQTKKITICFKDDPNSLTLTNVPKNGDFPNKIVLHFGVDLSGETWFYSAYIDGQYVRASKVYPFLYKQEILLKIDQIILNHAKDIVLKSLHQ